MALATGLAFGAAAASGLAVSASCSGQWGTIASALLAGARAGGSGGSGGSGGGVAALAPAKDADSLKDLLWQGFSMEEARKHADEAQSRALAQAPGDVLAELQRGNARFWMGTSVRPESTAFERRALISKQFPSVAILGCSDSRVPTEIVFDQGLGDLFVVRVAGNALDTATIASLQYAVHHLNVKVLMVLGHELCGAVKAAQLPKILLEKEPAQLEMALKAIKSGLGQERLAHLEDSRALDREVVTTNVKKQVERLTRDKGFMTKVRNQELLIVGAFYEISSGIVDFFHEVSGDDTVDLAVAVSKQPSRGVTSRYVPARNPA
eukprot:CAMPEP_0176072354 /NCGR_PEP_ID=MMETSP0120_2-20121206/36145_1 /TAXON_ID=160619 /ORGANISM="Kryptoperidinium foliaceum, Strain CCMP 1326" /LENGTH=322 /DNA_ID=CAMNT_0017406023 /DNA_START=14 /DNA_END=982 /DNA_ORIENTATION=-